MIEAARRNFIFGLFDICAQLTGQSPTARSGIICLTGGLSLPGYVASMPRDPMPAIGWPIGADLSYRLEAAGRINQAMHDGAIMAGFDESDGAYVVTGWSYRLFPPSTGRVPIANMGSRFYSALAMSCVDAVDGVVTWSPDNTFLFVDGLIMRRRGGE